ncbi:MAG: hypothetical protein O8C63_10850 [Candidatus Methanoperedens sp.]|nr:hypothetical protein [Candidatus Methanoperedens sp.]
MARAIEYSPEEKRIINTLYIAHKPLTTKNISERAEMAWKTAKKYLVQLYGKGIVDYGRSANLSIGGLRT